MPRFRWRLLKGMPEYQRIRFAFSNFRKPFISSFRPFLDSCMFLTFRFGSTPWTRKMQWWILTPFCTYQSKYALKSFETSYTSYLAQKDNVALANSVYDVTLQNYNEGVSPLTDLLQAEYSKIQSQSQLIESLLKVKQAEVALLKSKGEIKNLLI